MRKTRIASGMSTRFWIAPDGSRVSVAERTHTQGVLQHPETYGVDLSRIPRSGSARDSAVVNLFYDLAREGWIRGEQQSGEYDFQSARFDTDTVGRIQDFLMRERIPGDYQIFWDVFTRSAQDSQGYIAASVEEFLQATGVSDFRRTGGRGRDLNYSLKLKAPRGFNTQEDGSLVESPILTGEEEVGLEMPKLKNIQAEKYRMTVPNLMGREWSSRPYYVAAYFGDTQRLGRALGGKTVSASNRLVTIDFDDVRRLREASRELQKECYIQPQEIQMTVVEARRKKADARIPNAREIQQVIKQNQGVGADAFVRQNQDKPMSWWRELVSRLRGQMGGNAMANEIETALRLSAVKYAPVSRPVRPEMSPRRVKASVNPRLVLAVTNGSVWDPAFDMKLAAEDNEGWEDMVKKPKNRPNLEKKMTREQLDKLRKGGYGCPAKRGSRKIAAPRRRAPAGGGTFALTFPINDLLDMFGLSHGDQDEYYMDYYPDRREIVDAADQFDIPESALDDNPDIESEIATAMRFALESGTAARWWKQIKAALEECLQTFSDYQYEYFSEEEFKSHSGRARGIVDYNVDTDPVTIECAPDIVNVIQDCISGEGYFDVSSELEGETPEEYARTRFHWLKYYWSIYGGRKPEPNDRNIEDFDDQYFKEIMEENVMPLVREWESEGGVAEEMEV